MNKPRPVIIGSHILHNYVTRVRAAFGRLETAHGATHRGWNAEKSLSYIQEVFDDYLAYGGLSRDDLAGKTVLEIGPGDNLGVAMEFLAAGAARVIAVEKFRPTRDPAQERQIYLTLRERHTASERARLDDAVDLSSEIRLNPERLCCLTGLGIEDTGSTVAAGSIDLLISRAVLMEFPDSELAFRSMDRLLRPGGRSFHKIAPLHDYQMFRANGYHPLEFLTVPDALYQPMVSDSGKPNRRLLSYYRDVMRRMNYRAEFHVVRVLGSTRKYPPATWTDGIDEETRRQAAGMIATIRPRLLERYQALDDADLMTEDFFLVAQRPGGTL